MALDYSVFRSSRIKGTDHRCLWMSRPLLVGLVLCAVMLGVLLRGEGVAPTASAREPQDEQAGWSQWRGPNRDSKVAGPAWPNSLQEGTLDLVWRREFGPSYSGPVVSEDRVFITETKDNKYEVVHALDRETGETIWSQDWEGSMKVPFFAAENGNWIRSTPAFDGERLYVAGMRDVLVCLDAGMGEELWRVDFMKQLQTPLPQFGCVCSPLILDDHIYIQAGASLVKLNKLTGEIIWQTLRNTGDMNDSAFSSPFYAEIEGTPQLLVQTRSRLAGVLAEDGSVLWEQEVPAFRGMNILTPTPIGDKVFTSAYGGKSFLYDPSTAENEWQCETVWENRQQGYMSSPVVIDGHIYLHLRNQRFTCINAETGETCWTSKPFGKYWSMIAQGDRILTLDQRGDLLLIDANPEELTIIDQRQLGDDSWAHLGWDGNQVLVRELKAMSVYRWEATAE